MGRGVQMSDKSKAALPRKRYKKEMNKQINKKIKQYCLFDFCFKSEWSVIMFKNVVGRMKTVFKIWGP